MSGTLNEISTGKNYLQLRSMIADDLGNVYIVDQTNSVAVKISNSGTVLFEWSLGFVPTGICIDPFNTYLVVTGSYLVRQIFLNGNPSITYGQGQITTGQSCAIDITGNVYISTLSSDKSVMKLSANRESLTNLITGIAITYNGRLSIHTYLYYI